MTKIKVLAIAPDRYGTGYFRSLKPHLKLNEKYFNDFHVDIIDQKDLNKAPFEELKTYNIIHFSKNIYTDKLDWKILEESTPEDLVKYGEAFGFNESEITEISNTIKTLNNKGVLLQELRGKRVKLIETPKTKKEVIVKLNREILKLEKEVIEITNKIPMYGKVSDALIGKLKSHGVKFVLDFDDYWEIPDNHPLAHRFKTLGYKELALKHLALADYVTVTTPVFAQEIKKYNPNVIVLPNSVDGDETQWQEAPIKSDRVRIMWCGGVGHEKDIEPLKSLVNRLKSDGLINKVQIVLCGYDLRGVDDPFNTTWYRYERMFTDNFTIVSPEYRNYLLTFNQEQEWTNVENEPYRRVWSKPITAYASNYNMADIVLVPLEDTKFTSMKSQLKIIEAGWFGKPVVCSNVLPYTLDIVNAYAKGGVINKETGNGFLCDNERDFYKYVKLLINDKELRESIGSNLQKTIKEGFDLSITTDKRAAFYKEILSIS